MGYRYTTRRTIMIINIVGFVLATVLLVRRHPSLLQCVLQSVLQCGAVWCKCAALSCSMVLAAVLLGRRHSSVLQCVAVCCSVLPLVLAAVIFVRRHSSVLQCVLQFVAVSVCCSVLQCVAVCCVCHSASSELQWVAAFCRVVQCVLQCVAVCCSVLQCIVVYCVCHPASRYLRCVLYVPWLIHTWHDSFICVECFCYGVALVSRID